MTGPDTNGPDDTPLDEHGLIARYFRPLATPPGAYELIDDAAAFSPPPGADLVLTKDGIAEGIHFLPGEDAATVARKALRVNLSDLAAKGATPVGYLVLLGLPDNWSEDWIAGFASGLDADQREFGALLYGGDTIRAGGLVVSVTAFGTVDAGTIVRRSGARAGDLIYVSGTIGDGALGLLAATDDARLDRLDTGSRDHLVARYRLPQPRVALARAVREHASAALDVSDGLAGDLDKLCRASGISARIRAGDLPLSPAAATAVRADEKLLSICLTGGDDYEILCTVPKDRASGFERAASTSGVPVKVIGEAIDNGADSVFLGADGRPLTLGRRAFSHVDRTYSLR